MAGYSEHDTSKVYVPADTSGHRGLDMAGARKMLYEAGFTALRRGDGSTVPLTLESVSPSGI